MRRREPKKGKNATHRTNLVLVARPRPWTALALYHRQPASETPSWLLIFHQRFFAGSSLRVASKKDGETVCLANLTGLLSWTQPYFVSAFSFLEKQVFFPRDSFFFQQWRESSSSRQASNRQTEGCCRSCKTWPAKWEVKLPRPRRR